MYSVSFVYHRINPKGFRLEFYSWTHVYQIDSGSFVFLHHLSLFCSFPYFRSLCISYSVNDEIRWPRISIFPWSLPGKHNWRLNVSNTNGDLIYLGEGGVWRYKQDDLYLTEDVKISFGILSLVSVSPWTCSLWQVVSTVTRVPPDVPLSYRIQS